MKIFLILTGLVFLSSCDKYKKFNTAGTEIKKFAYVQDEKGNCFIAWPGYGATHYATVKPEDCK